MLQAPPKSSLIKLPQLFLGDGLTNTCKQSNINQSANITSVNPDHTEAFKRRDNTYFTRGYATTVNLHSRSLSVDSVIEETVETKWIASPFLKVT